MMIFGAGLLSSMSHIRGELGDMSTASIAAGVAADSAWLSVQPRASRSRAIAPRTLLRLLDFGPSMCWTDSLMLSRSQHCKTWILENLWSAKNTPLCLFWDHEFEMGVEIFEIGFDGLTEALQEILLSQTRLANFILLYAVGSGFHVVYKYRETITQNLNVTRGVPRPLLEKLSEKLFCPRDCEETWNVWRRLARSAW